MNWKFMIIFLFDSKDLVKKASYFYFRRKKEVRNEEKGHEFVFFLIHAKMQITE